MTTRSVAIASVLAIVLTLRADAATINPCDPSPCVATEKCELSTNATAYAYVCLQSGYRQGDCSFNAYVTCDLYAQCKDATDGRSFTCTCPAGATGDGFKTTVGGTGCKFTYKSCATNTDCPQYGTCSKDYKCVCNAGYQGDGYTCTDINECTTSNPCDPNAICSNYPGSFKCVCDSKRNYVGDGFKCVFLCGSNNDCDAPRALCNGSNLCVCIKGYQGDGLNCTDKDECAPNGGNNCNVNANCINTAGSFKCVCKNGYAGNGVNCTALPRSCKDIPNFVSGNKYVIDPDFIGPANPFTVFCEMVNKAILTKVPATGPFPKVVPITPGPVDITYEPKPSDITPLLENSVFCYQSFSFSCNKGFNLLPGTAWYDAYGKQHKNWGSNKDGMCACGEVKSCPSSCYCDGTQTSVTTETANVLDKSQLPVVRIDFNQTTTNKGAVTVSPLVCSDTPSAGVPKNCDDAKFTYKYKDSGAYYIDVDGAGILEPFLVYCNLDYSHVGVTRIPPLSPVVTPTTPDGTSVDYTTDLPRILGLISGSVFCSQSVEFTCQSSRLMAGGGYLTVAGDERKLNYFAGANGVHGSCGCGTTNSCDAPNVKCNCDIGDGVTRSDFGLVVNKTDLPVVKLTAEIGDRKSGTYTLGPLQCASKPFAIEPNCEKYRQAGVSRTGTYLIDPDGFKGPLAPFNVLCLFTEKPPQGKTVVNHRDMSPKIIKDSDWTFEYLQASKAQLEGLKSRSTYCFQEVTVSCILVDVQDVLYQGNTTDWKKLSAIFDSCGTGGTSCQCDGAGYSVDSGTLADLKNMPINKLDFSKVTQLASGGELVMEVGEFVCTEVFPTCSALQAFLKSNKTITEESHSFTGYVTIQPDPSVEPFGVNCTKSTTTVTIVTGTGGLGPDTNNPLQPLEKCFPIRYTDAYGNSISAAQIAALAKKSGKCKQDMTLECKNAPATDRVNYTTCDGTVRKGWAGSFGQEKCSCGLYGNCAGGQLAKCNCDMNDGVTRLDTGTNIKVGEVPVCQICMTIYPKPPIGTIPAPTSSLKFSVGEFNCDGNQGTRKNCQDARNYMKNDLEASIALDSDPPIPYGCKFLPSPAIGIMIVKPETSVIQPSPTTTDIRIVYVTISLQITRQAMQTNGFCVQNFFIFCAKPTDLQLGGKYGWYSYDNVINYEWSEFPSNHDEINKVIAANNDLYTKCGAPRGFRITKMDALPVSRLVLAGVNIGIVLGSVECYNLKKDCQEIMDTPSRNIGLVSGKKFAIDADGTGFVAPFQVNCEFNDTEKIGTTEVPLLSNYSGPISVTNKEEPGKFEIPILYDGVTPEQANTLTQNEPFCWQGMSYSCSVSPIKNTNPPSTFYTLYNGKVSDGFGTASNISLPGCACTMTGTCEPGYSCHCDAVGKMTMDQGVVTDRQYLPITSFKVGGQVRNVSNASVQVTPLRCAKVPLDPPRDCHDALLMKSKFGINYNTNSEYYISPDPRTVPGLLVYCDFTILPGKGVTIINTKNTTDKPINNNPDHPNEVPYYGPTDEQLKAIVTRSGYCYQAVKFSCIGSTFLGGGSYWLTVGSKEKRRFWGGGLPSEDLKDGVCACGREESCGGLDSSYGQMSRRCNCDVADDKRRSDAGIISQKSLLPISQLWIARYAKFNSVNITVGPLYCSPEPMKFNECKLGFNDCHEKAECVDQDEGYICKCMEGWRGKGVVWASRDARANGRECIDDNECIAFSPCPYNANCTNTPGDFYCTCKEGYRQTGKTECEDIDECLNDNLNNCDDNARCENLDGSFRCICNKGFRGDGVTCVPVGQCACFGDTHCNTYDGKWLDFQSQCTTTMSRDGCNDGETPTFNVQIVQWKKDNINPGYFSWIKSVKILIFGHEIILDQDKRAFVDGILTKQYSDQNMFSVTIVNSKVKFQSIQGIEVYWDWKDTVEIGVAEGSLNKTCGLCGNYNNNPQDDLVQGPACPDTKGKLTTNEHRFGISWTVPDPKQTECVVDCNFAPPVDECTFPMPVVKKECNKIMNSTTSPFKNCWKLKSMDDLARMTKSCEFDLCHDDNLDEAVCRFAKVVSEDCINNEKVEITGWKKNITACGKPTCKNNMIYKDCGTEEQETCVSVNNNLVKDTIVCIEGCFCPSGLVMEDDRCIKREECGCYRNNGYMAMGDILYLPDCSGSITCLGKNTTKVTPAGCEENEECRIQDGVTGCYCKEGYLIKEGSDKCEPDICTGVVCEIANMECKNGTCVCKMGYIGDCNQCEDIDECATGQDNCTMIGQTCINLDGGFACGCKEGFVLNGKVCKDIDECYYHIDGCGANSECVNTPGSFSCECCAGYKKSTTGACVRDTTEATAPNGKCCACKGENCPVPGKVCGTDAVTYASYRSLAITACKTANANLTVDYKGACQTSCSKVICEKQFSNCSLVNGKPKCGCPKCEDSIATYKDETVCATNKVTYTSICHMKQATCEAEFETKVDVLFTGKSCPGRGVPVAGPWSDWGDCSEKCKQGTKNRTRDVYFANANNQIHDTEYIPCYNTCDSGPCRDDTCKEPGKVCVADDNNQPSCQCPTCADAVDSPACGRVVNIIMTYDNECQLMKEVCDKKTDDFEVLEPRACEEKPVQCGLIRNYRVERDSNGCVADRSINFGACYGGCDDDAELCCHGTVTGQESAIMRCSDGTKTVKFFDVIKGCDCITKDQIGAPKMQVEG
ncbi:uncharacterized protein LOC131936443 [Physella acuta]|uniref:uncharacterized protein LOC131936443 n=1 Tax=Physella acuta TaxID=109671 RepID=UPI0027DB8506|nr:uncharacterized protein LOC131936443 [Physella acuta]